MRSIIKLQKILDMLLDIVEESDKLGDKLAILEDIISDFEKLYELVVEVAILEGKISYFETAKECCKNSGSDQKQNKSNDVGFLLPFKHRFLHKCLSMLESLSNLEILGAQMTESYVWMEGKDSRLWQGSIYARIALDFVNPSENRGRKKRIVSSSGVFVDYLRDMKNIYEANLANAELLNRMCKTMETSDENQTGKSSVCHALTEAVYRGNFKFIASMAKANPEFLWENDIARLVFEVAIEHREAKVFSLIYDLPNKVAIASYVDRSKNNLLHKAALLAHPMVLNRIPGAALQMQRELQWFKEVEKIVSPAAREWKNAEHLKPCTLFTESHKDLVIKGEKWMKETSSSFIVLATLIASVTFASAFSVPGGNNQDTDFPTSSKSKLVEIFVVSDTIALFSSTTSVLIFLGILTSRYAEEDFLVSLPTKLIVGLSTLFLSLAAMTVAFCACLAIMSHLEAWTFVPMIFVVNIPVAVFVRLHFPLLVNSFVFTCGPSIFCKSV